MSQHLQDPSLLPCCCVVCLMQALYNHALYHQNDASLCHKFAISLELARQVVKQEPTGFLFNLSHMRCWPQGLHHNAPWQMVVTHMSSSGNYSLCMFNDTCPQIAYASLHTGGCRAHHSAHCFTAFAILSYPQHLYLENIPIHTASTLKFSCPA